MKNLNQKLAVIQTELKAKKSSYNSFGKYYFRKAIVGVDLNQKGMQTAQQFGAASSYGKKYALGNLFLIDDTADADSTNSHGKAAQLVNKAKAKMTEEQYKKAVDFVKKGGAISAIESKYDVTPDQKSGLTRIKISN
jgi:Zn-dependent alcohol dehydrogenase